MTHLTTRSGAPLSALAFGAMQFGDGADEAASAAMYAACRAAGINHFDTAWGYSKGQSEAILGALIADERDDIYLATKVAADGGAGRRNIHRQFEQSLKRLGQDQVDLLYLHMWDAKTPLEETFEAMAELQARGRVRHIGVSNYAAWQVMKAQAVARNLGTRIDALQPMYNLVKRQAEVEILPMAADQGIAIFTYSPLGGGVLTGKYARGEEGRLSWNKMYQGRYAPDWIADCVARFGKAADDLGVDPATLAVAWVARHPGVTSPLISARSVAQLEPSLAAGDFAMDDKLYARLCALSPTPPPATDRLEEA